MELSVSVVCLLLDILFLADVAVGITLVHTAQWGDSSLQVPELIVVLSVHAQVLVLDCEGVC